MRRIGLQYDYIKLMSSAVMNLVGEGSTCRLKFYSDIGCLSINSLITVVHNRYHNHCNSYPMSPSLALKMHLDHFAQSSRIGKVDQSSFYCSRDSLGSAFLNRNRKGQNRDTNKGKSGSYQILMDLPFASPLVVLMSRGEKKEARCFSNFLSRQSIEFLALLIS